MQRLYKCADCSTPTVLLAAGHGLGADEARLAVAALQCLQRLAGASVVAQTVGLLWDGLLLQGPQCAAKQSLGQSPGCQSEHGLVSTHAPASTSLNAAALVASPQMRFMPGNLRGAALERRP